jgi:hypothetical protein
MTRAVAKVFADGSRATSVKHDLRALLAQRIYALCCGRDDVTDHNVLRHDLALQTVIDRAQALASGQRYVAAHGGNRSFTT